MSQIRHLRQYWLVDSESDRLNSNKKLDEIMKGYVEEADDCSDSEQDNITGCQVMKPQQEPTRNDLQLLSTSMNPKRMCNCFDSNVFCQFIYTV